MSGVTDPAEEYFKDGLWGWVSTAWEKLTSSGGRLFTASHGYDGTAWRKLALVWGFSSCYLDQQTGTNSGGGNEFLTFPTPASGIARVILGFVAYNDGSAATRIDLRVRSGTSTNFLRTVIAPAQFATVELLSSLVLVNPDFLQVRFVGCTNGDVVNATAWGYDMELTN